MNLRIQKMNGGDKYVTLAMLEAALVRNNAVLRSEIKIETSKIVNSAISELAVSLEKQFDEIGERFSEVDEKLEKMNSRIISIDNRLDYFAGAYVKKPDKAPS
jgi:DNA anti-recombination protein RmuC